MSPVSLAFHTVVTVSIGLKNMLRMVWYILTSFQVLRAPESWSNYFFHLFSTNKLLREVSARTGRYQLPIFHCTNVHP